MGFSLALVEKSLIHKKVQFQLEQGENRKQKSKYNLIIKVAELSLTWRL